MVIPDAHLRTWVIRHGVELADKLFCDKIILLGDYFDDWDAVDVMYRNMIEYLKEVMKKNPGRIIPLLGNHELSYLGFPCSGFNSIIAREVADYLEKDQRFLWCYAEDGILYSHAGFTKGWLANNNLMSRQTYRNHLGKENGPHLCEEALDKITNIQQFAQVGTVRGGNTFPSPVWADATELLADRAGNFTQVVGHTPMKQIEFMEGIYFTDVYSNDNECDEYLFVNDGEPQIVHYNELILGEE